nr:mobilization protein [Faecalibacterium prausnitzii]
MTAEEKLRIAYACKELHLTQSELVRRVLYGVNVKHTVVVAQGGEDAQEAISALLVQCSKVGSNLNPLARHFNSGGKDTEQLRAQILEKLSALTNFRLKAEETVGELYGNHQAFDLEKL